jgi:hypothetical protein
MPIGNSIFTVKIALWVLLVFTYELNVTHLQHVAYTLVNIGAGCSDCGSWAGAGLLWLGPAVSLV